MTLAPRLPLSPHEYLTAERTRGEKHVLWAGELFAMAGGTPAHNALVANAAAELRALTRRGPCRVFASDQRVYLSQRGGFVYPDVTVVCGPLGFYDDTRDVLTNPTLVVEVLSEGTEVFDRGEKAAAYRATPSLKEYLFVSQTERHVEHYMRRADGWLLREYRGDAGVLLPALDGALSLEELYLKVFDG